MTCSCRTRTASPSPAELTRGADPPAIVLTSSRDASDFGPLIAESGARGFVPKGELCGRTLAEALE